MTFRPTARCWPTCCSTSVSRWRSAANGQEGLQQAESARPDLILMDNVMPVMDGLEATRRLRLTPGLGDVPIISLSASAGLAEQARSLEVGANAFLAKPVVFDRLVEQLGQPAAAAVDARAARGLSRVSARARRVLRPPPAP
jgi:CheY-like chemotaxis protein